MNYQFSLTTVLYIINNINIFEITKFKEFQQLINIFLNFIKIKNKKEYIVSDLEA